MLTARIDRGVVLAVLLVVAPVTASAAPECLCRASGETYRLGEMALIGPANRPTCARCVMSANVTSWEVIKDGCPLADTAPSAPRLAVLEVPAVLDVDVGVAARIDIEAQVAAAR